MHPTAAFRETDQDRLAGLIARTGLAVIIGVEDGRPRTAHAPVLFSDHRLRFHLARANALTSTLSAAGWALAVVTGPNAYVSPDWYGAEDQAPTWAYLSAEIEGAVRVLDQADATRLLDDLSAAFESRLAPKPPWDRSKMSAGRFEAMLGAITAFEMTVERLEGVRKLSQNKSARAQGQLANALFERGGENAVALGRLIMKG